MFKTNWYFLKHRNNYNFNYKLILHLGTQKVSERVCFIQETFFGRMWTFTADLARGDTAYTNMALGAHTDSTYLSCPPGIQVFHCLEHDGTGIILNFL